MFTIAKLLKIMKPYIEEKQLSHFDKNLFNSFYSQLSLEDQTKSSLAGITFKNLNYQDATMTNQESIENLDLRSRGDLFREIDQTQEDIVETKP